MNKKNQLKLIMKMFSFVQIKNLKVKINFGNQIADTK